MDYRFFNVFFLASISLCLANPMPQMYGSPGLGYQPPMIPASNYPGRVNTRTVQTSYGPNGRSTVVRQQSANGMGYGTSVIRQQSTGGIGYGSSALRQSAGGMGYGVGQYGTPVLQNPVMY